MVKKIKIMTTWEAIRDFIANKKLKKEYADELKKVDLTDDFSIQDFLDNIAYDIQRLTKEQCDLLNLDYNEGYYISTWKNEYLNTDI